MSESILIFKIFSAMLGGILGSFLNALIYRVPREISIVKRARSHCPKCDKVILWYENIPILSYLYLRGKCSKCDFQIPIRYLLIEVFMATSFWFLFPNLLNQNALLLFLFKGVVLTCFVGHFFIDIDSQILPDSINIVLALTFLIFGIAHHSWQFSLLGGLIGFLMPLAVTWVFYKIKGQIGLGGGDIKLFGALGLYLGMSGIFQNLFISCFVGSIIGISLILFFKHKKEMPMPFGPSIIITASLQIFFPQYFGQLMGFIFNR